MSNSIDQHVVAMDFDTTKFEKGIETATNGLETLQNKLKLKDASQGLTELEKASNNTKLSGIRQAFETVGNGVSAVSSKISNVVHGITDKLSGITRTAKIAFGGIVAATTGLAASGGIRRALNLEHAEFMLRGLEADVDEVMKSVKTSVLDTAYGLDEAAVVAAQLTASGVQTGDNMTRILTGIAGVAAMTGRSYADIGNIFTTVAGQGQLMTMQLRQLEYSGINAAATMGKVWHKSEEEVREMVHNGEVNFEMFSSAMSEAFGEHAKRANETFEGSLANLKAALSRVGEKFATPGLVHLRDIMNATKPIIDNFATSLGPVVELFKKWTDIGSTKLISFLTDLNSKLSSLGERALNFDVIANGLDSILSFGSGVFSNIGETISKLLPENFDGLVFWSEIAHKLGDSFGYLGEALKPFADLLNPLKQLEETNPDMLMEGPTHDSGKKIYTPEMLVEGPTHDSGSYDFLGNMRNQEGPIGFLADMAIKFSEWTKQLSFSEESVQSFNNIITVFSNGLQGFGIIAEGAFEGFINALGPFVDFVVTKGLPDLMKGLDNFLNTVGSNLPTATEIANTLRDIGTTIGSFFTALKTGDFSAFKDFGDILSTIIETAENSGIISALATAVERLFGVFFSKKDTGEEGILGGLFDKLMEFLGSIPEGIMNGIRSLGEGLGAFIENLNIGASELTTIFAGLMLAFSAENVRKLTGRIWDLLASPTSAMKALLPVGWEIRIKSALESVMVSLKKFSAKIDTAAILNIAVAVGILAASLWLLSSIDPQKGMQGLLGVIALITMLRIAFTGIMTDLMELGSPATLLMAGSALSSIISIGLALLVMAAALKLISKIDPFDMAKGIAGLAAMMYMLVLATESLSDLAAPFFRVSVALGTMAGVLLVLTGVIAILGHMKLETLIKGILGMAATLGILVGALMLIDQYAKGGPILKGAFALAGIASAILALSVALRILGSMSFEKLAVAIVGLASGLLALGLAIEFMPKVSPGTFATIAAMGLLVGILTGLTVVIAVLGSMDLMQSAIGLGSIAAALGILVGALGILDRVVKNGNILKSAFAITMIAGVFTTIAFALKMVGEIGIEGVGTAIFGLCASLMALGIALEFMKGGESGATALMSAATAMLVLAPALFILSAIPMVSLVGSLVAIGIAMGAFAMAGNKLTTAIPGLIALSKTMTSMGLAAIAVSAGLSLLLIALAALATIGAPAILAMTSAIVQTAPAVGQAIIAMGSALISALIALIPQLQALAITVIASLLNALAVLGPLFITTGIQFILNLAIGISNAVGPLVDVGVTAIINLINSLANTIRSRHEEMYQAGKNLFMALLEAVWDAFGHIFQDVGSFITNIPAYISGEKDLFASAGAELGTAANEGASESMSQLEATGKTGVEGFMNAMGSMDTTQIKASFNSIREDASTAMGQLPEIGGTAMTDMANSMGAVDFSSAFSGFGQSALDSFNSIDMASSGQAKVNELLSAFQNTEPASSAGGSFGTAISGSFDDKVSEMPEDAFTASSGAIDAVNGQSGPANSAGVTVGDQFGAGMVSGINGRIRQVANTAARMVSEAMAAAKAAQDSASPSKATMQYGNWFGEGYAIGIRQLIEPVKRMSEKMVDEAMAPLDTVPTTDMLDMFGIDSQPVITPVLDLSYIESGAAQLADLLFTSQAMNMSAVVPALNSYNANRYASAQTPATSSAPTYNLYIDGAIVNSTPEIQRVIYDTFEVVSMYGGMNHGD